MDQENVRRGGGWGYSLQYILVCHDVCPDAMENGLDGEGDRWIWLEIVYFPEQHDRDCQA